MLDFLLIGCSIARVTGVLVSCYVGSDCLVGKTQNQSDFSHSVQPQWLERDLTGGLSVSCPFREVAASGISGPGFLPVLRINCLSLLRTQVVNRRRSPSPGTNPTTDEWNDRRLYLAVGHSSC